MADSCQAGAGSESKAGCSGGSAGTIYVQFWVANRVLEHHEHPPCLRPCWYHSYVIKLQRWTQLFCTTLNTVHAECCILWDKLYEWAHSTKLLNFITLASWKAYGLHDDVVKYSNLQLLLCFHMVRLLLYNSWCGMLVFRFRAHYEKCDQCLETCYCMAQPWHPAWCSCRWTHVIR